MIRPPRFLVFGAGLTGRGLVPQLVGPAARILYIDSDAAVVGRLASRRQFTLNLVSPFAARVVDNVSAVTPAQLSPELIGDVSAVFTAVGAKALPAVGAMLAKHSIALNDRNVVLCENVPDARALLLSGAPEGTKLTARVGVTPAVVYTSSFVASEAERRRDPLAVRSERHSELVVDAAHVRGELPVLNGVRETTRFGLEMVRKLYTYNGINAVASYLGWSRGAATLAQAMADPTIAPVVAAAAIEISTGLVAEFGLDPADQREFAARSVAKFSDRSIPDPLARQVRAPLRKLAVDERLVGPATLCLKHGVTPRYLALATAAALSFRDETDSESRCLGEWIRTLGLRGTLDRIWRGEVADAFVELVLEQTGGADTPGSTKRRTA